MVNPFLHACRIYTTLVIFSYAWQTKPEVRLTKKICLKYARKLYFLPFVLQMSSGLMSTQAYCYNIQEDLLKINKNMLTSISQSREDKQYYAIKIK